ncbi:MAG: serine protease [Alphaproteobacteria bacterium RIFOXYD12_FULL_60_8]|nr:MAG: serine protease [Alphaproteobacteria bacterium RIFOXYD12_FULL_60_8]
MIRMWLLSSLAFAVLTGPVRAETFDVPQSAAQVKLTFAPVVAKAAPAVVNIYTSKVIAARARHPLFDDPFFRQFFGDQLGDLPPGETRQQVQNSLGSGVILRSDGVVVTNHHVIEGADDIAVVLQDKREFAAKLVGSDPKTDLAILKIDPGTEVLPALPMADSDELAVGDLVLAIGNPFGVGQTVTSGIVSAVARTGVGVSDYKFFIQTDAAINPGNSGGALVDLDGRLLGINTAIYSKSGGSIGLGFAVPVNMVRAVAAGILAHGKPVRAWLGAGGKPVTAEIAQAMGLPRPTGVLVEQVHPQGPADRAGLKVGDLVMAVEGKEVEDVEVLRYRIATLPVGGHASMEVRRKGQTITLSVPMEPPAEDPPRDTTYFTGDTPLTGAEVANLNPALAEELGANLGKGPVVLQVNRRSIAERLGFAPGDVIVSINQQDTPTVTALKKVLERKSAEYIIQVRRGGKVVTVRAVQR